MWWTSSISVDQCASGGPESSPFSWLFLDPRDEWRFSPVFTSPLGPQLDFPPFPKPEAWASSSAKLLAYVSHSMTTPSWKWVLKTNTIPELAPYQELELTCPNLPRDAAVLYLYSWHKLQTQISYILHQVTPCNSTAMLKLGREDGYNYLSPQLGLR